METNGTTSRPRTLPLAQHRPRHSAPAPHPAPQPAQQPNMDVGWAAYFAYQKGVEKGKAQNPAYAPPPWSPPWLGLPTPSPSSGGAPPRTAPPQRACAQRGPVDQGERRVEKTRLPVSHWKKSVAPLSAATHFAVTTGCPAINHCTAPQRKMYM